MSNKKFSRKSVHDRSPEYGLIVWYRKTGQCEFEWLPAASLSDVTACDEISHIFPLHTLAYWKRSNTGGGKGSGTRLCVHQLALCMRVFVHMYLPLCVHARMRVFVHMYLPLCVHTRMRVFVHMYLPLCVHACVCGCPCVCVCARMRACMYVCMHVCVAVHLYLSGCLHVDMFFIQGVCVLGCTEMVHRNILCM